MRNLKKVRTDVRQEERGTAGYILSVSSRPLIKIWLTWMRASISERTVPAKKNFGFVGVEAAAMNKIGAMPKALYWYKLFLESDNSFNL
jgi:hypothetical protein